MSLSTNLLKKHLGIDDANPNHFELLGIDLGETDATVIKRAAKTALAKLGDPPQEHELAEWKQIQRQIKKAYQCLSNCELREDYLAEIETRSLPMATVVDEATETAMQSPLKSKTLLVVVVASLLIGGAIFGLSLRQPNQNSAETRPSEVVVDANGPEQLESKPDSTATNKEKYEGDKEPAVKEPVSDKSAPPEVAAPNRQQPATPNDQVKQKTRITAPTEKESKNTTPEKSTAKKFAVEKPVVNLDTANVLHQAYLHSLQRQAWLGLSRRDLDWTNAKLQQAESIKMTDSEMKRWQTLKFVATEYESVLNTVKQQAQESIDQKFKVEQKLVSIVEAKPNELVYRIQDNQFTCRYEDIPVPIAWAIFKRDKNGNRAAEIRAKCTLYTIFTAKEPAFDEARIAALKLGRGARIPVDEYENFTRFDVMMPVSERVRAGSVSSRKRKVHRERLSRACQSNVPPELEKGLVELIQYGLGGDAIDLLLALGSASGYRHRSKNPYFSMEVDELLYHFFPQLDGAVATTREKHQGLASMISRDGQYSTKENAVRYLFAFLEVADEATSQENHELANRCLKNAMEIAEHHQFENWKLLIENKRDGLQSNRSDQ